MKRRICAVCVGIALLSAIGLTQGQEAPRIKGYTLIIVELPEGMTNSLIPLAPSVSEPNRAVGYAWSASVPPLSTDQALKAVPFEWRDGTVRLLPLLPDWPAAFAAGINNRGDVIGVANKPAGSSYVQTPVLWSHTDGMPVDLGILPGDTTGAAIGINSRGQVVGSSTGPGKPHPWVWEDGVLSELPRPGGAPNGQAFDINDAGVIAGVSGIAGVDYQATVWDQNRQPYWLGTLGGEAPVSQAYRINNRGQVVGFSYTKVPAAGGIQRAFLWDQGTMYDLGAMGYVHSAAYGINSSTQIVGNVYNVPGAGQAHAFVWEDGHMFDLNDLIPPGSGMLLLAAAHINDQGVISGYGKLGTTTRGFLLIPEK